MAPPAKPRPLAPVPSGSDAHGPLFLRADIEDPKKRRPDGTPAVSIQALPVGSRLRIDGPGPGDKPVLFTRLPGRPDEPVVWECSVQGAGAIKRAAKDAAKEGDSVVVTDEGTVVKVEGDGVVMTDDGTVVTPPGDKDKDKDKDKAAEGKAADGEKDEAKAADGEKPPPGSPPKSILAGSNASLNYQSLYNLARGHWKLVATPESPVGEKKKRKRRKSKVKEEEADEEGRTLDDYKQGERFYKQLCGERDEEIKTLKQATAGQTVELRKELEAKTAIIDHLRAELVRNLESAAVGRDGGASDDEDEEVEDKDDASPTKGKGKKRRKKKKKKGEEGGESEKQRRYKAKLEDNWNARLRELKAYNEEHGNCNVPLRWKGNLTLGAWVNKQRENYRAVLRGIPGQGGHPKISDERIKKLDALGLCWNVRSNRDGTGDQLITERNWNNNYNALKAYREEHGDCIVQKSHDEKLSAWVYSVRRALKIQNEWKAKQLAGEGEEEGEGEHVKPKKMPFERWLTQERIDALNELGFVWSVRASPVDIWNERYAKLKEFKEQFGHCRVPAKYDKRLNQFILTMRHYYKNTMKEGAKTKDGKKFGTLSAEKIFKLQRLGFEWEVLGEAREQAWEARFRDMIRYRAEHGHCRVPKQYPPDTKLSHWVYEQRKNHKSWRTGSKRGRRGLTDERMRRLEEIGFEWSVLPVKMEPEAEEELEMEHQEHQEAEMEPHEDAELAAVAANGYDATHGYDPAGLQGLQGTGLQGTGLQETGLQGTGLQGTGLQGTGLQGTGLQGTGLQGYDLTRATHDDMARATHQGEVAAAAAAVAANGYDVMRGYEAARGTDDGGLAAAAAAARGYDAGRLYEAARGTDEQAQQDFAAAARAYNAGTGYDMARGYAAARGYDHSWLP